jgi:hypothetical protein
VSENNEEICNGIMDQEANKEAEMWPLIVMKNWVSLEPPSKRTIDASNRPCDPDLGHARKSMQSSR